METLINHWLIHLKLEKDFIMRSERLSIGFRTTLAIFAMGLLVTSAWGATEKVLYNFGGGADGAEPSASLIFDAAGNLYGTTADGGSHGVGTVFKIDTSDHETVLYSFTLADGGYPLAGLIQDSAGNFYGTTSGGGTYLRGTVFELTPTEGGGWKETVLHSFDRKDGYDPQGDLIFDAAGNLYGTTLRGGTS
jgi:uncharacterized repeat protein (TIGR03803 family)